MSFEYVQIASLSINRANDRHGELENETAAMAWLFNTLPNHMRNLANDIVGSGKIFEPPLVSPEREGFVVFDGNRRVTCIKLLDSPRRAPTVELQEFFAALRSKWQGDFPEKIECQVETDKDQIDEIIFRRHTGSQSGVGQSNWDDRMKSNFVSRTGKRSTINTAEEIETRLAERGQLPRKKIPRANLNRLLSADAFRNRVGFTIKQGKFDYTHQEPVVLHALKRIANDLSEQKIVLGDIWDIDGKRKYLDDLDREGVLPTADHLLTEDLETKAAIPPTKPPLKPSVPIYNPKTQTTLIPNVSYQIT